MDWDTFANLQTSSNLLGGIQRQQNLNQQQKVVALLEEQKREREQEQKRLDALPSCPLCKEKIQIKASICKHCNATLYYIPEFLSESHHYIATNGEDDSTAVATHIAEKAEKWRAHLDCFAEELLAKFRTILNERARIAEVCYARGLLLNNLIFQEMIVLNVFDTAHQKVLQNFTPIEISEETSRNFAIGRALVASPFIAGLITFLYAYKYGDFSSVGIISIIACSCCGIYATYFLSFYASRSQTWLSSTEQSEAIKRLCRESLNQSIADLGILKNITQKPIKELFTDINNFQKNTNHALDEAKTIYEYAKPKIEDLQEVAEKIGHPLSFDYEECDFLFYCDEFKYDFDAKLIDERCWPVWKKMTWVDENDYPGRFLNEVKDALNQSSHEIPSEAELVDKIVKDLRVLEEDVVSSKKHSSLRLASDSKKVISNSQQGLVTALNTTREKANKINQAVSPKIDELNKAAQPFINKAVDQAKQISAKVTEDVISRIQGNTALDNNHDDQTDDSNTKNIRINSDTPTWLLLENGKLVGPNSLGKIQQAYKNKKLPENSKLGFSENGPWRSLKPKKHPE